MLAAGENSVISALHFEFSEGGRRPCLGRFHTHNPGSFWDLGDHNRDIYQIIGFHDYFDLVHFPQQQPSNAQCVDILGHPCHCCAVWYSKPGHAFSQEGSSRHLLGSLRKPVFGSMCVSGESRLHPLLCPSHHTAMHRFHRSQQCTVHTTPL